METAGYMRYSVESCVIHSKYSPFLLAIHWIVFLFIVKKKELCWCKTGSFPRYHTSPDSRITRWNYYWLILPSGLVPDFVFPLFLRQGMTSNDLILRWTDMKWQLPGFFLYPDKMFCLIHSVSITFIFCLLLLPTFPNCRIWFPLNLQSRLNALPNLVSVSP